MAHAVVEQLRFTRGEWRRGLAGVTEQDATEHCGKMNSIGWIVGHLTWQEQRYLLHRAQGIVMLPDIQERFAYGAPMSTPPLAEVLKAWQKVSRATDPYLDSLATKDMLRELPLNGRPTGQSLGSAIRRLTYHYWFHIGEIQAIRQILGHKRLPVYVGNIEGKAPYRPEK
jgi:hypothetical protein